MKLKNCILVSTGYLLLIVVLGAVDSPPRSAINWHQVS